MQYTIRNIPKPLDKVLRAKAKKQRRSLNDVIIEAMSEGLRALGHPVKYRDLSGIAGTWVEDPAFDEAMKDFERIDYDQWGLPDPNRAGHQPVQRSSARRERRRRSA
jgi:hypothetical protein